LYTALFWQLFVGATSLIYQNTYKLEKKHKDELKRKDEEIAELRKVIHDETRLQENILLGYQKIS
jgi:hypothetical protein